MSWNNDIAENIKKLAGTTHLKDKPDLYYATVNTDNPYNIPARTCNVTLISGKSDINISSASLMPEVNDGMLLLPSPGSTVIIAKVANGDPFVVMYSQIDKVLFIAGDTQLSLDSTTTPTSTATLQQGKIAITLNDAKINIKNDTKNFTTVMNNILNHLGDLTSHLLQLTVTTGTGPSGTPINASDITNDQTNLSNDLSDLNDLLN